VSPARWAVATLLALAVTGCRRSSVPPGQAGDAAQPNAAPEQDAPVALNADSPIQYPPRLYDQRVEGDVLLRLWVDSTGRLAPESSRVAESSGYSALDSAALTGARQLRFAPGRRHGLPVATAFLQPVEFRHPAASGAVIKGAPDSATARAAAAPPRPRRAPTRRRRDATGTPPDTTGARRDSARASTDSGAGPH
jgi:TonB family protein